MCRTDHEIGDVLAAESLLSDGPAAMTSPKVLNEKMAVKMKERLHRALSRSVLEQAEIFFDFRMQNVVPACETIGIGPLSDKRIKIFNGCAPSFKFHTNLGGELSEDAGHPPLVFPPGGQASWWCFVKVIRVAVSAPPDQCRLTIEAQTNRFGKRRRNLRWRQQATGANPQARLAFDPETTFRIKLKIVRNAEREIRRVLETRGLLFNQSLVLSLQFRYCLCLSLKGGVLVVRRCLVSFDLLARQCKLVPKLGLNWRQRQFEYEIVEFLKLVHQAHIVSSLTGNGRHIRRIIMRRRVGVKLREVSEQGRL